MIYNNKEILSIKIFIFLIKTNLIKLITFSFFVSLLAANNVSAKYFSINFNLFLTFSIKNLVKKLGRICPPLPSNSAITSYPKVFLF
jgi:hypothetical protein